MYLPVLLLASLQEEQSWVVNRTALSVEHLELPVHAHLFPAAGRTASV
jgi:hypothetical protein